MYIKGFAISRPKIVQFFELDLGWLRLDRDEFMFIVVSKMEHAGW